MITIEYLGLSQKSLLSDLKSLVSFLKVISTQVFKTNNHMRLEYKKWQLLINFYVFV